MAEAPKAPVVEPPVVEPPVVEEVAPAPTSYRVKNISGNKLCMSNGILEPDAEGDITPAEYSNFVGKYVELV